MEGYVGFAPFGRWRAWQGIKEQMSMTMTLRMTVLVALLSGVVAPAWGQSVAQSPVGLWKTYDDEGKTARGIIRITETAGEVEGFLVKSLAANADADKLCIYCPGALKNQPMQGLRFVSKLRWTGEEYGDGEIIDPDSGTVYRATLKVLPDGKHLSVRGYVGISLFGRSQTWERAE